MVDKREENVSTSGTQLAISSAMKSESSLQASPQTSVFIFIVHHYILTEQREWYTFAQYNT